MRAISEMIQKHEVVKNLVNNFWLHLFQIVPGKNVISRCGKGGWELAVTSQIKSDGEFEFTIGGAHT